MKKYKIEIQEILSKIVEIEAASTEEAIENVEELYNKQEIILDYKHHTTTDFILKTNQLDTKDEKYILINEIIDYLIDDERKHFEELDTEPQDHIYLKLLKLKTLNNNLYG